MMAFCSLILPASSDKTPVGIPRSRPMSMMCRTGCSARDHEDLVDHRCPISSTSGVTTGLP